MAEARRQDRGFSRRPKILDYVDVGHPFVLAEEQARETAQVLVRRARSESGHNAEGPAPDPDAVREHREALHGSDEGTR